MKRKGPDRRGKVMGGKGCREERMGGRIKEGQEGEMDKEVREERKGGREGERRA